MTNIFIRGAFDWYSQSMQFVTQGIRLAFIIQTCTWGIRYTYYPHPLVYAKSAIFSYVKCTQSFDTHTIQQ